MIILLIILLLLVTYQDFSTRTIYAWFIPVLTIVLGSLAYQAIGWEFLSYGWKNGAFIGLQLGCLVLYFSIKHRQWINITERYLGLGDILFFIPMIFFSSTLNFIVFFIASLCLILISYLVWNSLAKRKVDTIPLAGGQALCMVILLIYQFISGIDLYNDQPIIDYLIQYNI